MITKTVLLLIALSAYACFFILVIFIEIIDLLNKTDPKNFLSNNNDILFNISTYSQNLKTSTCKIFSTKTLFAHRGGNITIHQENTMEVFVDSAIRGRSIEMDLMQIYSGEIVTFHDQNTLERLGISLNLKQTSWDTIKSLRYSNKIEGRKYSSTPNISLLKDVLDVICTINRKINLWFDIKYLFDSKYINALSDILDASPCECNDSQMIIVEIFRDTYSLFQMKEYVKNRRCKIFRALSYYDFQMKFGLNNLQNELKILAGWVDIIDFPIKMVKEFPQLLSLNNQSGICNSIYGFNNTELNDLSKNELVNSVIYNFYD